MEPQTGLLKIGDFARAAGTNLRTLRYYEELGLLAPTKRSEGGFRYYRTVDLHRVRSIQMLQDLGLSLEEIGGILSCRDGGEEQRTLLDRVESALARQEELIRARLERLEQQRRGLLEAREKLADCGECDHAPTVENNWCEPCAQNGRSLPAALSALF
jgi:DNA-binding transcriptional MerR regulator